MAKNVPAPWRLVILVKMAIVEKLAISLITREDNHQVLEMILTPYHGHTNFGGSMYT